VAHGGQCSAGIQGRCQVLTFLSQTDLQQKLHEATGYLPIIKAAYEAKTSVF
jgi:ABC-type glycerol-3-phosphate transport system substrate-binding protein